MSVEPGVFATFETVPVEVRQDLRCTREICSFHAAQLTWGIRTHRERETDLQI